MIRRRERREACVIGILYESDEWSDWKLGRELEAALAENALAETVPAEANSQTATRESDAADNSWRHVRMINMEDADAVEQARSCAMLVSRVFASAAFRGHQRSHRAMEDIIALAEAEGIPLINPGRAHHFEIDKRLATETLRNAGITAPAIIAWGTRAELRQSGGRPRRFALCCSQPGRSLRGLESPCIRSRNRLPQMGPADPGPIRPTLASSSRTAAVAPRTPLCCAALPTPAHS